MVCFLSVSVYKILSSTGMGLLDVAHMKIYIKQNIKVSSIQKKEGGSDRSVSNDKFSLVTLHELAMNVRESILYFRI